jgi:hypothetical protein
MVIYYHYFNFFHISLIQGNTHFALFIPAKIRFEKELLQTPKNLNE